MEYEALIEAGGMIGHGGVVLFDDSVNMAEQARRRTSALKSPAEGTPCRVGAVQEWRPSTRFARVLMMKPTPSCCAISAM